MDHVAFRVLSFVAIFTSVFSDVLPRYLFTLTERVALPPEMTNCTSTWEKSHLNCFRSCAANRLCIGVYIESKMQAGESSVVWSCRLCELTTFPVRTNFSDGDGIVARIKRFSTPPEPTDGRLLKTELVNGVLAAFYRCDRGGAKTFRLAFSYRLGIWPQLNDACRQTICHQNSLVASLVTVREDNSGLTFRPLCLADERPDGLTTCSNQGAWDTTSRSRALCISTTCSRITDHNRDVYGGTQYWADDGRTCQSWSSQWPHRHEYGSPSSFHEDNYNNQHNFCRDPRNDGYLWCYTVDPGQRYTACSLPDCM